MDKKDVVRILDQTATLLELGGADFFKVRAYRGASRALESSGMETDINTKAKDLQATKGIGKNIAGHIVELISSGTFAEYERLKASTPPGLLVMLRIPGMGAKKVKYLFDNLGISDMETLEQACLENRLSVLPGFGKKTQDNILKGIHAVKRYQQKFLYSQVIGQAELILEKLRKGGSVIRASLAGSLRRKKEIIKDIDIVASTGEPEMLMELFTGLDDVEDVIARGSTRSSIRLASGINADIRTVEDWQFPYALHHFTGSREHNTAMRSLSKKSGIRMNEYGLFKGKELIKCKSEKDIFGVFGMQYIPPELRENHGEVEAAQKGQLPALVEPSDIKGIIHIHTTYSDGKMTLEQAARKAMDMGFSYIGISEHSRSARYAGGLKEEDIDNYLTEIDRLNEKLEGFRVFKGIESDILNDGSLDYDDRTLERFDFVIIAIHSNFNMSKNDMTKRIIKALQHPYASILAHPTGRLLLARDPYEVDMEKIIDAAAQSNVDLELNSSPFRLDLDWRYGRYAKQKGVKVFIDPDAHTLDGLYDYSFGVNIARKGWLEAKDIANTMDAGKMADYLENKRKG